MYPALLKPLAEVLAPPLTRLFKTSMDDRRLPQSWKMAQIVPIHKDGSREEVGNYRPVSLTSTILKVMERIICRQIANFLTDCGIISNSQHGFRSKRSCTTNLLSFLDEITRRLDRGEDVEVAYLDFRKAFDSVNHRLLIHKLRIYGINTILIDWITEFLRDRSFYVEVEGKRSSTGRAVSGVPQGSVIGPLLFLIYINDLTQVLRNPHFMFADDIKIVGESREGNTQHDLNEINQWCEKWELPLNKHKCKQLVNTELNNSPRKIGEGANRMDMVKTTVVKDLGVLITADFKPHRRCLEAAKRANRALSQLQRTVISRKREILLPLYKAYVRPHLEYAIQAWHPSQVRDKTVLEKVQRRFTRMFPELRGQAYEERLRSLDLFSLERRRIRGDLIETFKILKGMTELGQVELFERNRDERLRGHEYKLIKQRVNTATRANYFSQRVINQWNNLPATVVEAQTLSTFKLRLDAHWETMYQN